MSKNIVFEPQNEEVDRTITFNKFNELFPSKSRIDEDTITSLKFIGLLEKQSEKIKKELFQMKNSELERILKEFLMHDYERRFSTTLDMVISALIGEDQTAAEFAHQSRLQKVFYINILGLLSID